MMPDENTHHYSSTAPREEDIPPSQLTQRRTIVTGAAWSVPVIAAALATPLAQASDIPVDPEVPDLGLDGWVQLQRSSNSILTIDGRDQTLDEAGLWVKNATGDETVTGATITFYFSREVGDWQRVQGGSTLWSVPVAIGSASIDGATVYGYRTGYSGTFSVDSNGTLAADDNELLFRTVQSIGRQSISSWAQRTVTVDGDAISFTRGPITLG